MDNANNTLSAHMSMSAGMHSCAHTCVCVCAGVDVLQCSYASLCWLLWDQELDTSSIRKLRELEREICAAA